MSREAFSSWRLPQVELETVHGVAKRHRIDLLVATVLVRRGIVSPAAVVAFISRAWPTNDSLPMRIAGMQEAVERVSCCCGERIFVFGDPDVDGVSAAAIMVELVRLLGSSVKWRIPAGGHHGLNGEDLDAVWESHAELLICVGCSIDRGVAETVTRAGIDVLVIDNQRPFDRLPVGPIVLNPELTGDDPSVQITSGAIALRLTEEVHANLSAGSRPADLKVQLPYDLAALSTLADCIPLTGENRCIVARGLTSMGHSDRPGLLELWSRVGRSGPEPTAAETRRLLNPLLEAAARFGEGDCAVSLLVSRNRDESIVVADRLIELDARRRSETVAAWNRLLPQARRITREHAGARCLIVEDPDLLRGLTGPIAFRLSRFFGMPVAVVAYDGGAISGSIRSPASGLDTIRLLEESKGLFITHGGHQSAGGFIAPAAALAELRRRWLYGGSVPGSVATIPKDQDHLLDAELPALALTPDLDRIIALVEPTGFGNKPLVFRTRRLRIAQVSLFGHGSEHCKLLLDTGEYRWPAVYWGAGSMVGGQIIRDDLVDVVYRVEPEYTDGVRRLRIVVLGICR